ncbi:MAG: DUF1858 domain-containing protein [Aquificae bacterium]|nr:DUF1858 domain-containing protein [Aquificota bacterium]
MEKITLKTTIQQVLDKYPFALEFFENKNMYCKTCKGKKHETLYYCAVYYGLDPEQFIKELKEFVTKKDRLKKLK